ncbi:MAG: DUF6473 family protein [Paracoccaceae bacterium]
MSLREEIETHLPRTAAGSDGSYVATLGGSETYGKFVPRPYAELTEELSGTKVVNLGTMNAGTDVYVGDQTVMEACARARATVSFRSPARRTCRTGSTRCTRGATTGSSGRRTS